MCQVMAHQSLLSRGTHRGIRMIEEIFETVALFRHGFIEYFGQASDAGQVVRLQRFEFPQGGFQCVRRVRIRLQR